MFDSALLAKIKRIHLHALSIVTEVFAGQYTSAFKGRGIEFEEVREYLPGDDVRNIDWNVTARTGRPFLKLFRDERELTVIFVVDVSASNRFGTLEKLKNEVAAEITAILACAALYSNDRVGLIIFSDHIERYMPPKKGRGYVWRIIREILTYKSTSKKTDFVLTLDFLSKVIKRKAVVFLISDFQGTPLSTELKIAARHFDLIAISIYDRHEINLPRIGYIEIEDAETGEYMLVNTNDRAFLRNFNEVSQKSIIETKNFLKSSGIDYISVDTSGNYVDSLIKFFKRREKRR